jgi:hypothetical protein
LILQTAALSADAAPLEDSLQGLNLSENELGDIGIMYLCIGMERFNSLRTLELSNTGIGNVGAKALAKILSIAQHVKDTSDGEMAFLAATETWMAKRQFDEFEEEGTLDEQAERARTEQEAALVRQNMLWSARVAEAARHVSPLSRLFLGYNKISNEGVATIALALKSNAYLRTLVLTENEITEIGCLRLLAAIRDSGNTTLQELHMDHNPMDIDEKCEAQIRKLFEECPHLVRLVVPGILLTRSTSSLQPIMPRQTRPKPVWLPPVSLDAFEPTPSQDADDFIPPRRSKHSSEPEVPMAPVYQSITAMPVHQHLSFEELRLRQLQVAPQFTPTQPGTGAKKRVSGKLKAITEERRLKKEQAHNALVADVQFVLDTVVQSVAWTEGEEQYRYEAVQTFIHDSIHTVSVQIATAQVAAEQEQARLKAEASKWNTRKFFDKFCRSGATAGAGLAREKRLEEQRRVEAEVGKGVDARLYLKILAESTSKAKAKEAKAKK